MLNKQAVNEIKMNDENLINNEDELNIIKEEIKKLEHAKGELKIQQEAWNASIGQQKRHIDQRNKELDHKAETLAKNQAKYQQDLKELVTEQKILKGLQEKYEIQFKQYQAEKEKFILLKNELEQLKLKIDTDFQDQRLKLQTELAEFKNKEINSINSYKLQQTEELNTKLSLREDQAYAKLEQDLAEQRQQLEKDLEVAQERKIELKRKIDDYEFEKRLFHKKSQDLEEKEQRLNEEVQAGIEQETRRFETEKQELQAGYDRLLNDLTATQSMLNLFQELKQKLNGSEPETIFNELQERAEHVRKLQEELQKRPTEELKQEFDRLDKEKSQLLSKIEELNYLNTRLKTESYDISKVKLENRQLIDQNTDLMKENEYLNGKNHRLQEELKLLNLPFEKAQEYEKRIETLQRSVVEVPPISQREYLNDNLTEMEWLQRIYDACAKSRLKFPMRILKAFHTALKTAEFSPITVLAGVSGTGKSQLPSLYARYGGLNFLPVPVQPNWDSQASMLGYFNSVTNYFEPQPLLNYLSQSQTELSDMVNIVLLDEMNLSHPELYFAEFLSRLEQRRGERARRVPNIEIDVGSGMDRYKIPLKRNVLWIGTMNQDETTKSLSDKVIDRSFVIHFPRPKTFHSIEKLTDMKQTQSRYLPLSTWDAWKKIDTDWTNAEIKKQIDEYKEIVEKINEYLDKAGRALGHRVWQSIEFYMANYPDVIEYQSAKQDIINLDGVKKALKDAFEDQLVQKVMPKLRGIETRGRSRRDCLDQIRHLLDENDFKLVDDFDHACTVGHGQFMWNSAYYLEDSES
ncbi:MAG: chromosome partitioning protein ParA [Bacilli bacterium]